VESKGALLTVAIPLIAFKIWFAILLLSYAPTRDTTIWIAATHWPLLVVVGLLIVPGIQVYRLLKARAKRDQLRRAEFMVDAVQCSALWDTVSRLEGGDSSGRVPR
jgi:nitrogen fixation/metabolism regulation signal transduction histidine kinase